jgi:hypothetical protein
MFGLSTKQVKTMQTAHPTILEVYYDESYPVQLRASDTDTIEMLSRYVYEQRLRKREKWYADLIMHLMNSNDFRTDWQTAQKKQSGITLSYPAGNTYSIKHPKNSSKKLTFYYFNSTYQKDPRFTVQHSVPADIETFTFFKKK